jgi:hypothetical protein
MSMSPTHETAAVTRRLVVDAKDAQSDILILDSRGRLVERGLGPVQAFALEDGIYRVKVVTGKEVQERPVILTGKDTKHVAFEALRFASPIPLDWTSTSHEYHMAAAAEQSRKVHVRHGAGSSVFLFVRDYTPDSRRQGRTAFNPGAGLSLHAVRFDDETLVADIGKQGVFDAGGDPWCACTVELDPGVYELRLALPTGEVLHQAVVASPGWQTQAFLFVRDYAAPGVSGATERRADLARSSILMTHGVGFSHGAPDSRSTELARVALATTRPVAEPGRERRLVPDDVRNLLGQKFDNPMLGIYGGHLLLLEAEPDLAALTVAVENLRNLVGPAHPDVEALALRTRSLPQPLALADPPMLRRSWALMVDADVERPDIIADALSARISTDFWLEGPWHVWRTRPAASTGDGSLDAGLTDLEVALAHYLGIPRRARAVARTPFEKLEAIKDRLSRQVLAGLASAGVKALDDIGSQMRSAGMPPIEPQAIRKITRQLNLSQAQLSGVFQSLQEKLAKLDSGIE